MLQGSLWQAGHSFQSSRQANDRRMGGVGFLTNSPVELRRREPGRTTNARSSPPIAGIYLDVFVQLVAIWPPQRKEAVAGTLLQHLWQPRRRKRQGNGRESKVRR